jgi:hypothetical protein
MNRKLPAGILRGITEFCKDTEIPSIFALWSAISTISAALGRDCFINQGHFNVYPNTYIVLVAGSAKCRKSTSINMAYRFIDGITPKIKMLSQKMTPEALIGSLAGQMGGEEGSTIITAHAEGIAVVDELATMIDSNAFKSGMIPILTKLYDCEDFTYETRGRGLEDIANPCLSILGGSTLHWIKESIPLVAIGGGFTSRVVFVYRDQVEKLIPWPSKNDTNDKLKADIVHDLNLVAKLRGPFAFDAAAKKFYSEEYIHFINNSKFYNNKNLSGYAGRRHIIILKLSMAVSASERDERLVTEADVKLAVSILANAEETMPSVLAQISSEPIGDVCEEVLSIIKHRKSINRRELLTQMRHKLVARDLDVILDTLSEMGAINSQLEGKDIIYVFLGLKG